MSKALFEKEFFTHSIRRSAARWAAHCGADDSTIKRAGRWYVFSLVPKQDNSKISFLSNHNFVRVRVWYIHEAIVSRLSKYSEMFLSETLQYLHIDRLQCTYACNTVHVFIYYALEKKGFIISFDISQFPQKLYLTSFHVSKKTEGWLGSKQRVYYALVKSNQWSIINAAF